MRHYTLSLRFSLAVTDTVFLPVNHSCEPSAEMILVAGAPDRWEVRVGPKALAAGDEVTFFYPSSEWDMAQGFDCGCGKAVSFGCTMQSGASADGERRPA